MPEFSWRQPLLAHASAQFLYMPANFQVGCSITGVARKVKSLQFCRILYVKKRASSAKRASHIAGFLVASWQWPNCSQDHLHYSQDPSNPME
jgi:hypothetical protein